MLCTDTVPVNGSWKKNEKENALIKLQANRPAENNQKRNKRSGKHQVESQTHSDSQSLQLKLHLGLKREEIDSERNGKSEMKGV